MVTVYIRCKNKSVQCINCVRVLLQTTFDGEVGYGHQGQVWWYGYKFKGGLRGTGRLNSEIIDVNAEINYRATM